MDISALKPGERTVEIRHPATGLPLGVRVNVCSIDDERLKKLKREIMDERMKLEQRNKSMKAEDIERNAQRLLFTAARGWEWYNPTGGEGDEGYDADAMPFFNDEQPAFSQANFMQIIRQLPWFADQLHEEVGDTKSFFENSKTN